MSVHVASDLSSTREPRRVRFAAPRWLLPPRLAMGLVGFATVGHFVVPVSAPQSVWVGQVLLLAAIGVNLWADGRFKHARTPILPHARPTELVTDGPFRYSRNPMYLGIGMGLFGIALMVGGAWFDLVAALFLGLVRVLHIPLEERNLEREFGDAYREYRENVRRWL